MILLGELAVAIELSVAERREVQALARAENRPGHSEACAHGAGGRSGEQGHLR